MVDVVMVILIIALVYLIIMEIKVDNAYRNCLILVEAIHLHNMDYINSDEYNPKYLKDRLIEYDVSDEMTRALFRLFDWGYTNILPQDIFERIVPYLDEAEQKVDQKHAKRK